MKSEQRSHYRHRCVSLDVSFVACLFFLCLTANAHTPHDAIDALHISPAYDSDSTLFVIVQNRLLRSSDSGETWLQLTKGIDSPHLLSDISISPYFDEDGTLFVSTDGGGVYQSTDQGRSWRRFNAGLRQSRVGKLLVGGTRDHRWILAAGATRGLFISDLSEDDWRRVLSDDVQITSIWSNDDPNSVFALAGDSSGGLWKSNEDLEDWQRILTFPGAGAITAIANSATGEPGAQLFVGTAKSGVLRVERWGESIENISQKWTSREFDCRGRPLAEPIADLHIRDIELLVSDAVGESLYVSTAGRAVYLSPDGGETWQVRNAGMTCDDQADSPSFTVPHFRDLETSGANHKHLFVAGFDGLYRSSDGSLTWEPLETLPISLIRGLNVSVAHGDEHALAVTTYGGGAYLSLDQGRSWVTANDGLVSTRLADIEFSPSFWRDGAVFSLSMQRLLKSRDVEKGWTANSIMYRGWRRKIGVGLERRLGFSSKFGSELFLNDLERRVVWPMQIELSPAFEEDATLFVGFRRHGVWTSTNGGEDWNRDWVGPTDYVTALQISPDFENDHTVFAGIRGSGIYVTRDGGKTWNEANSGFESSQATVKTTALNYINDPPLQRAINDVALVISPDFDEDATLFASLSAGLFYSVDAGVSWRKLDVEEPLAHVPLTAIAISPDFARDNTILAGYKGHGLLRSTDRGQTFHPVSKEPLPTNFDLIQIRFSPDYSDDSTIYAATEESLWVSRNGGSLWNALDRPVRYEDWRGGSLGPVRYVGDWHRETSPRFSASTQTVSSEAGAEASLRFFGSNITWMGERGPDGGKADVTIDNQRIATVDLYSPNDRPNESESETLLTISDLERRSHIVRISVRGDKNANSAGFKVAIDRFDLESTARLDSEVWH